MAGYYYDDPSGLGSWYVPDGSTPAQALQSEVLDTGATVSPILAFSVANTPNAQKLNGGNPSPNTKQGPPPPTGYTNQGANLIPTRVPLAPWQYQNSIQPRKQQALDLAGSPSSDCPDGYFYDAFSDMCVPIDVGPGIPPFVPGGGQPGTTADTGTVFVVNNAVNLSTGVGQAISDAVAQGINDAVDQAKAAAADAAQAVEGGIQDTIDAVSNASRSLLNDLTAGLKWIGQLIQGSISSLVEFITNNIGKVISSIGDVVNKISDIVQNTIVPILTKISDVITNTIAPIFQAIQQTYQQTAALISSIQRDISNGINGILQLPTDLANGFSQIGADIDAALGKIYINRQGQTAVGFDFPDGSPALAHLQGIGANITSVTGADQRKTTFADHVKLPEPTLTQAGGATFDAIWKQIASFITDLLHGGTPSIDALKSSFALVPFLVGDVAELPALLVVVIGGLAAGMIPLFEFIRGTINSQTGLEKLPPAQALQAYVRGFIDVATLQAELGFKGYDKERIQALTDLQTYLIDVDKVIDMWFRGVVADSDLAANLTAHAITSDDQAALRESAYRLVDVNTARTALRWGVIGNDEFTAVLKQNRYTDNEIALEQATLYQHEAIEDVIARENRELLFSGLGFTPEGYSAPSPDALDAARRRGEDATKALDTWQASYFVLPLQEWIVGYFRNLFDTRQLKAAFDYYRVPTPWRDIIINNRRPLIPWRTIPSMVANGILDSSTAGGLLQQHGFDLFSTNKLLEYAALAKPKTTTKAAGELFGLSVGTAKAYFEQGTLTAEQYSQVLQAHGYNQDSAALAVKVESARIAQLQRKQLADDITAEVLVGTLSLDQAQQMMEANQFTDQEKSRIFNAINRSKRQANKLPSEGELHDMAKTGAISIDTYRKTMSQIGWSDSWITNFVNWRFPSAAQAASTS